MSLLVAMIFGPSGAVFAETYTYDKVGRLTKVVFVDGSSMAYAYDNNGNILSKTLLKSRPIANDQTVVTDEDMAVAIKLSGSDPESDPLTFTLDLSPSKGVLSLFDANTGDVTYAPDPNFNGSDSFTFKVNDGTDDSNIATVSITITPVNDIPTCVDVSITTPEDVQGSTNPGCIDIDGDPLTFSIASQPSEGTASIGSLIYDPNLNTSGLDSFTYKANDGTVDSNIATVSVTVTAVNDAPNGVINTPSGNVTIMVGESVTFSGTGTDPENDPLTFLWDFDGGAGNSTLEDPGAVTFNTAGFYTISFTVTDSLSLADPTPDSRVIKVIPTNGLLGEYYDNADLSDRVLERFDPNIDFTTWAAGSPDPGIGPDTFSVRWTGKLLVDFNETYTFNATTDDGVRLWIDGHLVIDYWQTGGISIDGIMDLTTGKHDLKLEFFEDTGEAFVQLYWSSPSTQSAIIPNVNLFPPVVEGSAPVLSFTGELDYSSDGLHPEMGNSALSFAYHVMYSDADSNAPASGFPRVHILDDGVEITGSPFAMVFESGDPLGGSIYSYSTTLPDGTDYSYYFDAKDSTERQAYATPATSTPTAPINAPLVGDEITSAPPSIPELISPTDGETGLDTTVTFVWGPSNDPEGDPLSYSVTVCEDDSFEGCDPIAVASALPSGMGNIAFAGYGIGFLMAGIVLISGIRNRRTVLMVMGLIILTGMLQVSCSSGGGGGGDDPSVDTLSHQVSGLNPATTYSWKVSVDDGQGNIIESSVRTFSTQ